MSLYNSADSLGQDHIKLTNTNTAVYNTNASPAVILGNLAGLHLEMSPNRILSKANASTGSELYINYGTGKDVYMTDMWPTREVKVLKAMLVKLCETIVTTPYTYTLSRFSVLYNRDSAGTTITIGSSYIDSTQKYNHQVESVVGNTYDAVDYTCYTKLKVTGYHNGTTYGNPGLVFVFSDSTSSQSSGITSWMSGSGYPTPNVTLSFTSSSGVSTTFTLDITNVIGTKYLSIYNVFTKYRITSIQLSNS